MPFLASPSQQYFCNCQQDIFNEQKNRGLEIWSYIECHLFPACHCHFIFVNKAGIEAQLIPLPFYFFFLFVHCSHHNSFTSTAISQEIPSISSEMYPAKLALSMPECALRLPLGIAPFRGIKLLPVCLRNLLPSSGKKTSAWKYSQVMVIFVQTGIITNITLYVIIIFLCIFTSILYRLFYSCFQVYLMCLFGELCNVPVCQNM